MQNTTELEVLIRCVFNDTHSPWRR